MNPLWELIFNVTGITCLLAGTTVAARILRLTRQTKWRLLAGVIFLGFSVLYILLVSAPVRGWLGFRGRTDLRVDEAWIPTLITIALCVAVVVSSSWAGRFRRAPDWLAPLLRGVRPLLIPGSISAICLIVYRLVTDGGGDKNLWPLILASAAFLYLWWLAASLFDLVFVWHRYIRGALIQKYLRPLRPARKSREEATGRKEARGRAEAR